MHGLMRLLTVCEYEKYKMRICRRIIFDKNVTAKLLKYTTK